MKTKNSWLLRVVNQMFLRDIKKILWGCPFGYKNLLNFTCLIMKFHNCYHANGYNQKHEKAMNWSVPIISWWADCSSQRSVLLLNSTRRALEMVHVSKVWWMGTLTKWTQNGFMIVKNFLAISYDNYFISY